MVTRRRSAMFFFAASAAVAGWAGLASGPAHAAQLCYDYDVSTLPMSVSQAWVDENGVTLYPYQPGWFGTHYGSLTVNGVTYPNPQPGVAYGPTPVEEFQVCKSDEPIETTTTTEVTTTTAATTTTAQATTTTQGGSGGGATTTTATGSGGGATTVVSGGDGALPVTGPDSVGPLLAVSAVLLGTGVVLLVRSRQLPA